VRGEFKPQKAPRLPHIGMYGGPRYFIYFRHKVFFKGGAQKFTAHLTFSNSHVAARQLFQHSILLSRGDGEKFGFFVFLTKPMFDFGVVWPNYHN
jgi:hypothetical protein